jgi:hypothetical protein
MISPAYEPLFSPFPSEIRRALTNSLLAAWLGKNSQYPIAEYLPIGLNSYSYTSFRGYGTISGGKAWEATNQFRRAGVTDELIDRLQQWGAEFTDRAARIRYE